MTLGTPAQLASSNRRASSTISPPSSAGVHTCTAQRGDRLGVEIGARHHGDAVVPAQRRRHGRGVADDLDAIAVSRSGSARSPSATAAA